VLQREWKKLEVLKQEGDKLEERVLQRERNMLKEVLVLQQEQDKLDSVATRAR
jgi:hypothetical protein